MSIGGGASLGSASGEIRISTDRAEANVKQLQGTINKFGATAGDSLSRVATGFGLLAAARGIGNIFGGAISGAANFEQAMSGVGAALGGVGEGSAVTTAQFKALNEEALRIGSTTSKSATEAAVAMDLMAKAGVGLEEILEGGAQGAVNLAEATGEALPQAAQTLSSVLNLFEDLDPQKATDIIAAGLGQSSATLSEFETGVARLAPAIGIVGLTAEEAAAGVAYFNKQGLSAAEAGSSLNSAILALASPTGDAAAEMQRLGISAFDANHQFIGFPALMDQVATATAGMGDDTKAAALELIFGRDALDVMGIAAAKAGDGLRDTTVEVSKLGTAATASAQRMDNLRGDAEELSGVAESISNTFATKLLPAFRDLTQGTTEALRVFARLPESLQFIAIASVAAVGAIAGIAGVMVLAGPRLAEFKVALQAVRAAMIGLAVGNPILLALVASVALLGLAYKTNFGGLGDYVDDKLGFVQRRFGYFTKGFSRTSKNLDRVFKNMSGSETFFKALGVGLRDALGIQGRAGDAFVQTFNKIGKVSNDFVGGIGRMTGALGDISRIIQRDGLAQGIDRLFGDKGQDLLRGFGEAAGTLPRVFGMVLGSIKTGIGPIDSILANAGAGIEQLGRSIELAFSGDFSLAGETLGNAVDRFLAVGDTAFDTAVDVVVSIGKYIAGEIPDLWDAVKRFAFGLAGGNSDAAAVDTLLAAGGVGDGLTIKEVAVQIQSWIVGGVTSVYDAIKDWVSGKTGGLGANTSGIGAGGSFSGGGLPITGVGLSVVSWAVDAVVGVYDAIKTWVSGHTGGIGANTAGIGAGGSFSGGGIPIGDVAVSVGNWVVSALSGVGDAIRDFVLGGNGARTTDDFGAPVSGGGALATISNAAISIGSWLVETTADLGTKVKAKVDELWPTVQAALGSAWEATVSIGTWIAEEAQAGTLKQSVQDKADALLASAGIEITDFKLTIGALGIENVDFKGVTDFFTKPIEFPPGTAESANAYGVKIGEKIQELVRGVVNAIPGIVNTLLSSGGGGGGRTTDDFGAALPVADTINSVVNEFIGGLIEGLLVNVTATIDKEIAEAKAGLAEIVAPITEFVASIGDAITGAFGGGSSGARSAQIDAHGTGSPSGGSALQGLSDSLLSGLQDAADAIVEGVDAVWESIKAALTPDLSGIALPSLPSWVTNPSELLGPFDSLIDKIEDAADRLKSAYDKLKGVIPGGGDAGEDIPEGPPPYRKPNFTGGGGAGNGFENGLGMPSVGEIQDLGRGLGLAGGQGIAGGFTDAGPEVQRRIAALFNIGDGEATSSGSAKGALHGAGIAAGIASAMPTIQANIRAAINAANSGGGDAPAPQGGPPKPAAAPTAPPPPVVFPAPNLTAYLAGLATAVQALQTAVGVIGAVAQGVIAPLGAAASSAASTFASALGAGLGVAIQITYAAMGAIQAAASSIGSLYGEGYAIGASLGQGIAIGIASSVGVVMAAASGVVRAAAGAARAAAEIGSPSKLFARTIGVPIGQGVAVGLGSTAPLLNQTMANLIGGIPSQSASTARMVGSQPSGAATRSGGGGNVYVFALKSDEWVDMVRKNERGAGAANYVDELHGAFAGMMGG